MVSQEWLAARRNYLALFQLVQPDIYGSHPFWVVTPENEELSDLLSQIICIQVLIFSAIL